MSDLNLPRELRIVHLSEQELDLTYFTMKPDVVNNLGDATRLPGVLQS